MKRHTTSQRKTLQKELLLIFFNNFTMISQEDFIPIMKKPIEGFLNNSIEIQLDSKKITLLKANTMNQKNKSRFYRRFLFIIYHSVSNSLI